MPAPDFIRLSSSLHFPDTVDNILATFRNIKQHLALHRCSLDEKSWVLLWHGIFYCTPLCLTSTGFWMADTDEKKEAVLLSIEDLFELVRKDAFSSFLKAFYAVISHEWNRVDRFRCSSASYLQAKQALRSPQACNCGHARLCHKKRRRGRACIVRRAGAPLVFVPHPSVFLQKRQGSRGFDKVCG